MIIFIRLLVIISAYLMFLTPILTVCTSLKVTILIQSFAVILLSNYLAYVKDVKSININKNRCEKIILNLIIIIFTFIAYRYSNIIGLSYIFGIYGSILVLIPFYLFSKDKKVVIPNNISLKIFNVIWAGLIINFIGYPYMKLNFINVENNGAIPVVSFINRDNNFILISILYVCIVFVQILIDRKSISIKKYMNDIIFYQYCIGILMFLIPTLHLIYIGVL
ncbi:hypothetical protein [Clostridium aminobutyricum]|uniref:Uncharacterized protein n=1 Tax=Clostridium aminobutyricum TaxID=33953 RepID=A0A939D8S3_CLOAM|nr:hypothetical protein [Clostridium aminobutyricum]MBN7773509.1 hypothetical protein [Clostridium aminobutyricum]